MIDQVKILLDTDISVIIKTDLSMSLIRCYSVLYNNGKQIKTCERFLHSYHSQLKKDGMSKAILLDKVKNRTCVPNWGEGLIYSNKSMCHFSAELMHDELAISLLKCGARSEKDFDVLPEGYEPEKIQTDDEILNKEIKLEELNTELNKAIEVGDKKLATKLKKAITRLSNN